MHRKSQRPADCPYSELIDYFWKTRVVFCCPWRKSAQLLHNSLVFLMEASMTNYRLIPGFSDVGMVLKSREERCKSEIQEVDWDIKDYCETLVSFETYIMFRGTFRCKECQRRPPCLFVFLTKNMFQKFFWNFLNFRKKFFHNSKIWKLFQKFGENMFFFTFKAFSELHKFFLNVWKKLLTLKIFFENLENIPEP